jgi:UDP-glucose 4-epimerase
VGGGGGGGAATGGDPGHGPINIAGGQETSILALVGLIRALLHVDAAIVFGPPRSGDVRRSRAAVARQRERLGLVPAVTLEQGLRDLLRD